MNQYKINKERELKIPKMKMKKINYIIKYEIMMIVTTIANKIVMTILIEIILMIINILNLFVLIIVIAMIFKETVLHIVQMTKMILIIIFLPENHVKNTESDINDYMYFVLCGATEKIEKYMGES